MASDVSEVLGYRTAYDMTRNLFEDEKGTQIVRTPGGNQQMAIVNEPGFYYAECVHRRELFDAMAKAVGKEPEELRSKDARSLRFEAAGVEFFWAERLEEGGDA